MLKALIELIGPVSSGKSILSQILAMALQPTQGAPSINVLIIDACADQGLTISLKDKLPESFNTLTDLAQQLVENEPHYRIKNNNPVQRQEAQQALDWEFSNLPETIVLGEETDVDLLTVGLLTEHLPPRTRDSLSYGFSRFLKTYDYVVVDGYHPLIHPLLAAESNDRAALNTVVVSPPGATDLIPAHLEALKTPFLLLTQYEKEPLSPLLQQMLETQDIKLIGKVSAIKPEIAFTPDFVAQFYDCLRFLDLPLTQTQAAQ